MRAISITISVCDLCTDTDGDGYGNPGFPNTCAEDNCPSVPNPNQNGCCDDITHVLGDVNDDDVVTSADVIYLINFVFKSGPEPVPFPEAGDVNCTGTVTAADVTYLVNYVFKGGPEPCDICGCLDDSPQGECVP